MDQYIGRLLDNRYEILEIIGTGGMAVVYKARCHRLNRLVAIKILKDEFSRDEEFRRRFHAEGEAVAMLSHPNIVQVYDVSSTDNANFIVMELIDGISLKQYMESKGVLNWKETLHFSMQIAKALEHAHSRGIIHRDIKPHNVMVLKNGSVKVMDFGIARVMSKSNTLTKEALGSVHYISPEQAKGGHTDNRSDIYSLGVVMYEMMTGRPPYDGESPVSVAIQHINGGAMMPSALNPNIPGGLEQIIMKCMALEMNDRYNSATELLADMEEFRKNPAILFDYHMVGSTPFPPVPMTTAERVVQAKTGVRPQVSTDSMRIRTSGTQPAKRTTNPVSGTMSNTTRNREIAAAAQRERQRRMEEERKRDEDERSRIATVAIVVCSAVAIFAIAIFLVALFNGALLNRQMEYVKVPNLIGQTYSESLQLELEDWNIQLLPQQYDDQFAAGQIMHQEPAGGTEVKKGSDIWLTISMGEEPVVKTMSDFVNTDGNVATSILEGQGFVVIPKMESNDTVPVGLVIRTDPVQGTELTEGQDVYLFISSGPVTAQMPNVVGKMQDDALELLDAKGFVNIKVIAQESDQPMGQVIVQSEEPETNVNVAKEIILTVSDGSLVPTEETTKPTAPPEPEPTEPPEMITKAVTFDLPRRENSYTIGIFQNGVQVVHGVTIEPGMREYTAEFTGYGSVVFELFIDGNMFSTRTVEFRNG